MIIVPAPKPKRRGFASTWLPWLVLGAFGFVIFVLVNFGDRGEPGGSPEQLAMHAGLIQARGLNCPSATRLRPQPQDAFGSVTKVSCSNGVDFRVTFLAGGQGFRVEPWR
ncbi:MAG: hypothetical protein JNK84_17880 [Phreatobacter sp.]|uniref:hypothetical protein n=1 Tax=Phreatobacter sp. TaxID=1966341 RepID=UPI001A3A0FF5|nr:hypothetical protein [Phreatobacter sp.]MBL8570943.1 hypothetical protein [Phreatobacter sp.]